MPIQSYFNQVSSLAPKIWYRFNETAGIPVNSGSATNTFTGSVLLNEQTDVDGRAVYFNDSRCLLSNMPEFTVFDDRSFTIETWFRTSQTFMAGREESFLWSFRGRTTNVSAANNNVAVALFNMQILGPANSVVADRNKIQFNTLLGFLGQDAPVTIKSNSTVIDDKWHHVVAVVNTTFVKLYLDGQLVGSAVPQTSTRIYLDDPATHFGTNHKVLGAYSTANEGSYKGRLDEFAVYGYELTAQNVLDNFNAGASVEFVDAPGTASALMVMPTFSVETVIAAAPMTASSLFVDTYVSNFDYVDGIQKIIYDLSPHQWIKFDANTDVTRNTPAGFLTNYGSGGSPVFSSFAVGDAYQQKGPGQEPRLELRLGAGTGSLVPGFATTTTSAFFTDEISDNNFSIGIWFKMPTGIDTSEKQIFSYSGGTNSAIGLRVNNKKVVFTAQTSHTTYTHTETNDISEDAWHLAVIRLDLAANTLKYYLDGTEVFSDTAIQGTRNTPTTFQFGKNTTNGTDTTTLSQQISHFFVTTYAAGTATVIDNLWDAGTRQNQAKGVMTFPVLKFDNRYDQVVASLNPLQQVGFNDLSGTVLENVGSNINTSFNIIGTNYVRGTSVPTKNRYGFNFTNKNTYVAGSFNITNSAYSDNTQTISVYAKIPAVTGADNQIIVLYGAGGGATGIGLSIMANASGPYLAIFPTANPANAYALSSGSTSWYGDWHLYTAVRDGTTTRLYIDGEQVASGTYSAYNFTDTGQAAIGGGETVWLGQAAATVDKYIDEFASFDYALSAQQITEMYQAIEIDRMNATNATFPMPTNIAGTGNTQTPAPMTASSLFVEPVLNAETNELAISMDAFAQFILPNFGGNIVIDANYGHTAATASALMPDPQHQIGDEHSAGTLNASALFVHPAAIAGGAITVSTAVGGPAELVMPGIVTIKGAQVFAQPATAKAFLPLPPAYLQLTDDQWYVRLFAQHAAQNIEPAFITGSLGTTASTQVAKTILKFFDDVTSSITVGNGYLENDLQEKIFEAPGSTNNTKRVIYPSIAPNLTPTPALYTGYFDDFGRKAVRVENIEFAMPEEIHNSLLPFSLEFSIKTTKANQIIAKGKFNSFYGFEKLETGFGLYDGKLYMMNASTDSRIPGNRTPHPANPDMAGAPIMLGRKNIADGQWHHIIVQYGFSDDRIQFWCDGQLDRQVISAGLRNARLYIMGSNNGISTYQSDFETSGWSYDKQAFISEQDVSLNYIGYLKYEPIKAAPMTATITMTADNKAAGNRGRAILFYFWPESTDGTIAKNPSEKQFPGGQTFDSGVTTDDYFRRPPQEWYGWDLHPVDITGRYVSELVRPEAYGVNNIKIQEPSFVVTQSSEDPAKFAYKVNTDGHFVDPVTDARRYIDVFNDIDLTQFDAIFFKNYPEETVEKDAYTREEFADEYFNLRERELFDNFIKSLRKALDTGISLFVTNHQLAIDLGIIDRIDSVDPLYEGEFGSTDAYVTNLGGIIPRPDGDYIDLDRNNKHRVVNTLQNLTNDPGYIWEDWAYFESDPALNYGGANRPYTRIEYRANGLQVGDEFLIADELLRPSLFGVKSVPIANIKAGKVITAFSNQVLKDNTLVDNPYKDYATTIAVEPGTLLNGKPTVGKIFVAFTEGFNREFRGGLQEYFPVDLIQDEFINRAYNDGEITLANRDQLLASPDNLDRRMEAAVAANNQNLIAAITALKYWTANGDYILSTRSELDPTGSGVQKDGLGKGVRKGIVNRVNKSGAVSTQTVTSSLQNFTFTYAHQYQRASFVAASILSRGIRWLSDKIIDSGLVNRVQPMTTTTAILPMPVITGNKPALVNATSMVSNAMLIHAPGYALQSVSNTTLPLTATAVFGEFVKNIKPDVFTANAIFAGNVRTLGVAEDQIVVYINHVDPILYIREEIIK